MEEGLGFEPTPQEVGADKIHLAMAGGTLGSVCCSIPGIRVLVFESSHRYFFLSNVLKREIREKEAGNGQFLLK